MPNASASSRCSARTPRTSGGAASPAWRCSALRAGPSSDVDLLIEVGPHAGFTLVDLAGLERFLSGLLLRPVEFAFPSRLRERPRFWRRVQADALDVL
jgi:predicted nucleotidyltransferase